MRRWPFTRHRKQPARPKRGSHVNTKGGTLCPRKGLKGGQYEPGCVLFVAERHGHRRVRTWQSMEGRGEVGDMLKWEGEDMVNNRSWIYVDSEITNTLWEIIKNEGIRTEAPMMGSFPEGACLNRTWSLSRASDGMNTVKLMPAPLLAMFFQLIWNLDPLIPRTLDKLLMSVV